MPSSSSPPASSPPDPPRVSFDDLPTELLKRIVDYAAQNRVSTYTGLSKGAAGREKLQNAAKCDEQMTVVVAHWTAAYGRELESLSKVNKRLRRLAMPLLLETLTCKQLISPNALYRITRSPYASCIRSLDLSSIPKGTSYANVAQFFPLLPSVDSLTINADAIDSVYTTTPRKNQIGRHEDAISAFAHLSHQPRSLSVKNVSYNQSLIGVLLQLCVPSELRHFSISGYFGDVWHDDSTLAEELRDFFVSMTKLESLDIDETMVYDDDAFTLPATPDWHKSWRMPSVRRLKVSTYKAPAKILPLFASALPNAQNVSLRLREPMYNYVDLAQYQAKVPPIEWPSLAALGFHGNANLFPNVLSALSQCPNLRHIDLSPTRPKITALDRVGDILPDTAPAHLRQIIFRPYDVDSIPSSLVKDCKSWCKARGIRFAWRFRRSSFSEIDYEVFWEAEDGDPDNQSERSWAVQDVLLWACFRTSHLHAADDVLGLDEMAKLTRPLRERRHIERGTPEQDSWGPKE